MYFDYHGRYFPVPNTCMMVERGCHETFLVDHRLLKVTKKPDSDNVYSTWSTSAANYGRQTTQCVRHYVRIGKLLI